MSLQMSKNIDQLSEDGKQATLCLMNLITKTHGAEGQFNATAGAQLDASSSKNNLSYNIKVQIFC